jgi:hypothetical protein
MKLTKEQSEAISTLKMFKRTHITKLAKKEITLKQYHDDFQIALETAVQKTGLETSEVGFLILS